MTKVFYTVNLLKSFEIEDDEKILTKEFTSKKEATNFLNIIANSLLNKENYFVELLEYTNTSINILFRS
jgi:hypothetical protein